MRLYVTPGGAWTGTQADARAACQYEAAPSDGWKEIDVPTDKPGLLEWLNANAGRGALRAGEAEAELERLLDSQPTKPAADPVGERYKHDIDVEQAIHDADLPRAIRLCEAAMNRVREHAAALSIGEMR